MSIILITVFSNVVVHGWAHIHKYPEYKPNRPYLLNMYIILCIRYGTNQQRVSVHGCGITK